MKQSIDPKTSKLNQGTVFPPICVPNAYLIPKLQNLKEGNYNYFDVRRVVQIKNFVFVSIKITK